MDEIMNEKNLTRRRFIERSLAAGTAAGLASATLPASSYLKVVGASDRIRIGQLGCGGRNRWHTQWVKNVAGQGEAEVVAACEIWKQQRESMAAHIHRRFGEKPRLYASCDDLLGDKGIDALIIATPDHQHCAQLSAAVKAGKDVYIEKPIARTLDELDEAREAVASAKAVVQHGTQGRSSPGAAALRELIRSGKLGRLFRVESTETAYEPYWNHYPKPESESDTNWKAFLHNRPDRPFDPDQHGSWMGYHEFSSGPIGGWMSHFSDFVHTATGCGFPTQAIAHGGIYAPTSDRRRTAPDTVTCVLSYAEGFVTEFTTHFGSSVDNESTTFFFERGVVRSAFGHNPRQPVVSGDGSDHPGRPREDRPLELPPVTDHMLNWLECIRTREQPAASMDAGYMQGVAVVMGDLAYVTGKKVLFDPGKRELRTV